MSLFAATALSVAIKNQNVIRLSRDAKPGELRIVSVDVAPGAGLATIAWNVQLPDGRTYNLTGAADPATLEKTYESMSGDKYRDNLFFQNGVVATLFPMTNRLRGEPHGADEIKAKVHGVDVVMPLNNVAKIPGAIRHHLHGLVYGQTASDVKSHADAKSASVEGSFIVGGAEWTGQTQVTTTTELIDTGYVFHLHAKNIGKTPVPVGAGAHPYFASPDQSPESIRVLVPAKKTAEIDNLSNVLPTGKIVAIPEALNFTKPTSLFASEIPGNTTPSRLDNLWLEPVMDSSGHAYTEVYFPLSKFKVRMTALTKNIIGIQGYAPKYSDKQKPFVALELVTNLPDPREQLWGATPTGMKLLQPGETFEYGYKVELLPL